MRKFIKYFAWIAIAIALSFAVNYFQYKEQKRVLYDLVVKISGKKKPNPNIVLVEIKEDFFKEFSVSWPLSVKFYNLFLQKTKDANAKIIAFDFQVNENDFNSKKDIKELCDITSNEYQNKNLNLNNLNFKNKKLPNTVLIFPSGIKEDNYPFLPTCLPFSKDRIVYLVARQGTMDKDHLKTSRYTYGYYDWEERNYTMDLLISNLFKNVNLMNDPKYGEQIYTNYAGPKGTYPSINFLDILHGSFDKNLLKDKIVLVGRGDKLSNEHYHNTPFHKVSEESFSMTRTEIHANIVNTFITGKEIKYSPQSVSLALILIFSIFTVFVVMSKTPLIGIIFVVCEFAFLSLLPIISYKFSSYYIDVFVPLITVFLAYYLFIPYRLIIEYKKRWKYEEEVRLLSQVEELKRNFLSLISHNLKTPIARIQGMAEVLLTKIKSPNKEQKDCLDNILLSSEELSEQVSKILNLSQIELKGVNLQKQSKDINVIINESLTSLKFHAERKNLKIETKLEPLFPIKIDPKLIKQVLDNLLENAIKYSPDGKTINIKSEEAGHSIKISISDEGYGIAQKDLNNIFEKFYRIKDERREKVKGTGLGLYLAKYFTNLHGGEISVESDEGKGSTFIITLPNQ